MTSKEGVTEPVEPYKETATINGIEIKVGPGEYGEYEMFFPQIDLEIGADQGVADQALPLDDSPETAKRIFEFAKATAEGDADVYSVFRKVETFRNSLDK